MLDLKHSCQAVLLHLHRRFFERRKEPRLAVPGASLVSVWIHVPQHRCIAPEASLLDLSGSGCKIQTEHPLPRDASYQLILHIPTYPHPIVILTVAIKWVQGNSYGVQFLDITAEHQHHLQRALDDLPAFS